MKRPLEGLVRGAGCSCCCLPLPHLPRLDADVIYLLLEDVSLAAEARIQIAVLVAHIS